MLQPLTCLTTQNDKSKKRIHISHIRTFLCPKKDAHHHWTRTNEANRRGCASYQKHTHQ